MKKLLFVALSVCLLGLFTPEATMAKGKKKEKAAKAASSENALAKYDTNKDGVLDADEVTALKKEYTDNKSEDLKKYDANNDGKIDESEVDAIKTDFAAAPKQHKHKKK